MRAIRTQNNSQKDFVCFPEKQSVPKNKRQKISDFQCRLTRGMIWVLHVAISFPEWCFSHAYSLGHHQCSGATAAESQSTRLNWQINELKRYLYSYRKSWWHFQITDSKWRICIYIKRKNQNKKKTKHFFFFCRGDNKSNLPTGTTSENFSHEDH